MRAGRRAGKEPRDQIRSYIAAHAPKSEVDRITDYLLLNLRGLSAYARLGYTQKKLNDCARTAGRALEGEFARRSP
jgi:TetR/AcrR family transcriptional repressor for divergent bdcA